MKKAILFLVSFFLIAQLYSQNRFPVLCYLKDSVSLDSFYIRQLDTFFQKHQLNRAFDLYILPSVLEDNYKNPVYYNGVIRAQNVINLLVNRFRFRDNNIYIIPQREVEFGYQEYPIEYINLYYGMRPTKRDLKELKNVLK